MKLYNKLYFDGFTSRFIQIKAEYDSNLFSLNNLPYERLMIQKILIYRNKYPEQWNKWIPAWHGTKFKNLESIAKYGLHLPGQKLEDGTIVENPKDIPLKDEIFGIKNWEHAIFASSNIYFALNYSDIIDKDIYFALNYSNNKVSQKWSGGGGPAPYSYGWKGLVEIRIRPNSFTKHKSKCIVPAFLSHFVEGGDYSVEDIYRIASPEDIIIISITFVNYLDVFLSGGDSSRFKKAKTERIDE